MLLKAEISQSQSPHLASCRAGCCSPEPGQSGWLTVSSWGLPLCRGRTAPLSSGMSCPGPPRPAPASSPAFGSKRPRQSSPPSSLKYKTYFRCLKRINVKNISTEREVCSPSSSSSSSPNISRWGIARVIISHSVRPKAKMSALSVISPPSSSRASLGFHGSVPMYSASGSDTEDSLLVWEHICPLIPLFLKYIEYTEPISPKSPSGSQRHHLDSWIITFHVLVQLQRHANVTDLDALKVALDDNVTWLHVTVQQPLLIVKILQEQTKHTLGASTAASIFLVNQSELIMYLKTSGYVQRHLFYVGSRKRLQAVLSPLLDKVIERLLSSVLHSEALGTIFGCGESTKTLMQEKWGTKLKRNDSGLWRMQTNCSTNTTNVASFKLCW